MGNSKALTAYLSKAVTKIIRGSLPFDFREYLEAIDVRHLYIEEKDLGFKRNNLRDCVCPPCACCYDLCHACFVNEAGQSTPSDLLVIDDDNAQH